MCPLVCHLSANSTSKLLSVAASYYIVVSSQSLQEQRVRNVAFWDVNETERLFFFSICVWVGIEWEVPSLFLRHSVQHLNESTFDDIASVTKSVWIMLSSPC